MKGSCRLSLTVEYTATFSALKSIVRSTAHFHVASFCTLNRHYFPKNFLVIDKWESTCPELLEWGKMISYNFLNSTQICGEGVKPWSLLWNAEEMSPAHCLFAMAVVAERILQPS